LALQTIGNCYAELSPMISTIIKLLVIFCCLSCASLKNKINENISVYLENSSTQKYEVVIHVKGEPNTSLKFRDSLALHWGYQEDPDAEAYFDVQVFGNGEWSDVYPTAHYQYLTRLKEKPLYILKFPTTKVFAFDLKGWYPFDEGKRYRTRITMRLSLHNKKVHDITSDWLELP